MQELSDKEKKQAAKMAKFLKKQQAQQEKQQETPAAEAAEDEEVCDRSVSRLELLYRCTVVAGFFVVFAAQDLSIPGCGC